MPGYAIVQGIAAGPDGAVWATEGESGQIARVTPAGGVTEFTAGSGPAGITSGSDGRLWFTDAPPYGDSLGALTTTGAVHEYTYYPPLTPAGPSSGSGREIVASNGQLWFIAQPQNAPAGDEIAHATTAGALLGTVVPPGTPTIVALALGPDGDVWFTQDNPAAVGRIDPTGHLTTFSAPFGASDRLAGLAPGPDGRLWALDDGSTPEAPARIARVATSGSVSWVTVPGQSQLGDITRGPDGDMWFTAAFALGRVTPAGAVSTLSDTAETNPGEIIAGPDGNLWFTYPGNYRIGIVSPRIPCRVPSVLGLTDQQATLLLNANFCTLGSVRGHVRGGDVASEHPAPGTKLATGASVELTFAGASRVTVSAPARVKLGGSLRVTMRGRTVGGGNDLYIVIDTVRCAASYTAELGDPTNTAAGHWDVRGSFRRTVKLASGAAGRHYLCAYIGVGPLTTARASRSYLTR